MLEGWQQGSLTFGVKNQLCDQDRIKPVGDFSLLAVSALSISMP